jgi:hypothetical protein
VLSPLSLSVTNAGTLLLLSPLATARPEHMLRQLPKCLLPSLTLPPLLSPLLPTLLPPVKAYWVLQGLHCGDLGLRQYLSLALPLNCSAAPTALHHTFRLAIPPALLSNALRCQSFASACKPLPVAVPRAPCINQPLRLRMGGVSALDRSG